MGYLFEHLNEANLLVFNFFNKNFGISALNEFVIFLDKFGGPYYFHYQVTLIAIIATITFYHHRHSKTQLKELFVLGTSAGLCLSISIILELLIIVKGLKGSTSLNRPYCSLDNIYIIPEIIDRLSCNRSFPSGHLAFYIILVTSFWNLLNRPFKITSIIFMAFVAISRMSSGAHYPLDLLGATIICLPLTIYIRNRSNDLVRHCEKKWDIFEYLYRHYLRIKSKF